MLKLVDSMILLQNFEKQYTDKELYKKYGLTNSEIDFIERNIKEMV